MIYNIIYICARTIVCSLHLPNKHDIFNGYIKIRMFALSHYVLFLCFRREKIKNIMRADGKIKKENNLMRTTEKNYESIAGTIVLIL